MLFFFGFEIVTIFHHNWLRSSLQYPARSQRISLGKGSTRERSIITLSLKKHIDHRECFLSSVHPLRENEDLQPAFNNL